MSTVIPAMLIVWHEENAWSIQSLTTIDRPRREFEDYKTGEKVFAKFKGSPYPGVIVEISGDRNKLKEKGRQLEELLHADGLQSVELTLQKLGVALKGENDQLTKKAKTERHVTDLDDIGSVKHASNQIGADSEAKKVTCGIELFQKKRDVSSGKEIELSSKNAEISTKTAEVFREISNGSKENLPVQENSRKEFNVLKDDVRRLKRKLKDVEAKLHESTSAQSFGSPPSKKSQSPDSTFNFQKQQEHADGGPNANLDIDNEKDDTFNGHTLSQLKDAIGHLDKLFDCIHTILCRLFTVEYILSHSVSGQRANKEKIAKPKFDERLFNCFLTVIKSKFPAVNKTEVTAKVQAVQKKYKNK